MTRWKTQGRLVRGQRCPNVSSGFIKTDLLFDHQYLSLFRTTRPDDMHVWRIWVLSKYWHITPAENFQRSERGMSDYQSPHLPCLCEICINSRLTEWHATWKPCVSACVCGNICDFCLSLCVGKGGICSCTIEYMTYAWFYGYIWSNLL